MDDTYIIEVKELEDGSGNAYLQFPPVLFEKMGWKEGDDVKFTPRENGSFTIKKVKHESIDLDFDDEELFKYMQLAHNKGQSFNEFVEEALVEMINKTEFESECG